MIKVLIAEDEEGILYSISNAFSWENMGCEIIGLAQNGIQALEYSLSTPPDIVISDIVMPGIDGITFLRYLKEKYPNTQFIILTGHRNFEYACDALNLGAAVFLLKPVNYKELENHLKKIINTILASQEQQQIENQQDYILSNLLSGHVYSSIDFHLESYNCLILSSNSECALFNLMTIKSMIFSGSTISQNFVNLLFSLIIISQ